MPTLKELRERAILSQFDLASKAKVGRATIAALESGDQSRKPRPSTIRKLARALKVKPEEIEF